MTSGETLTDAAGVAPASGTFPRHRPSGPIQLRHGPLSAGEEERFRRFLLDEDLRKLRAFVILVILASVLYTPSGWRLLGNTPLFWQLQLLRVGFVVLSLATLLLLRARSSIKTIDGLSQVWCLTLAVFMVFVTSTRPPGLMAPYLANLAALPFLYLIPPMRVLHRLPAPLLLSAGTLALLHRSETPFSVTSISMMLLLAATNLISYLTARRMRAAERLLFHNVGDERRLRKQLQDALAEIKTLEGIVPICMDCKRIRDDVGFWRDLEVFLSRNTEANFSHGLCPPCLAKRVPP